jgi:hypothetical protein
MSTTIVKRYKTVYPKKVYTTLRRACVHGHALPNYVQPVFNEGTDGLIHEAVGFAVGPSRTYIDGIELSYRVKATQ